MAAAKSEGLFTRCTQALGMVRAQREEEDEEEMDEGSAERGTKAGRVVSRLRVGLDESDDGMLTWW